MNKGLEALKVLIMSSTTIFNTKEQIDESVKTIEKELKEKETQDDYIEMLEDRINNLETTYSRYKKALEVIRSHFKFRCLGISPHRDANLDTYFVVTDSTKEMTKQEYELLKEVML